MKSGYWKSNSYLLVKSTWGQTIRWKRRKSGHLCNTWRRLEGGFIETVRTKTNCNFLLIHKTYVLSICTAASDVCKPLPRSAFRPGNTAVTQTHRSLGPDLCALSDEMISLENWCWLPLLTAALRRQRIAKSLRPAQAREPALTIEYSRNVPS